MGDTFRYNVIYVQNSSDLLKLRASKFFMGLGFRDLWGCKLLGIKTRLCLIIGFEN